MTFNHVNRRTHLYLAMCLLPWFLIYGVSSICFSHPDWMKWLYDDGKPQWSLRFERSYDRQIPEEGDLRDVGRQVLADMGIPGAYGVSRRGKSGLNIWRFDFRSATRVTYDAGKKWIRVEDRRFRWDHLLTGLHARGGFQQDGIMNSLWGVVVDVVSVGFLVWIASGLVMWWHLPRCRRWGTVALAAGLASFVLLLVAM